NDDRNQEKTNKDKQSSKRGEPRMRFQKRVAQTSKTRKHDMAGGKKSKAGFTQWEHKGRGRVGSVLVGVFVHVGLRCRRCVRGRGDVCCAELALRQSGRRLDKGRRRRRGRGGGRRG